MGEKVTMRPTECPQCGEMIEATDLKCNYCGAIIEDTPTESDPLSSP